MNQLGLAEWWSGVLDREHRRCRIPSVICREIGDLLLDAMLIAGL